MKKGISIPALFILLFLVSFKYSDNWVTYKSIEGHYSMSFPGTPTESESSQKSDNGNSMTLHLATYSHDTNVAYMSDWVNIGADYPANKTITQILEDSRDAAVKNINATSVTTKLNLSGNPFVEYSFKSKDFVGKGRFYIINKYQYGIIAIYGSKMEISSD